MRDELVVALLAGVALLLLERLWEIVKSIRDTSRERREWIAFLDEWLAGGVGTCREVRTVLRRFLRPWQEFERVITAGQGTADAPEFPMIRLERPVRRQAPRSLLRCELDGSGRIRLVHAVLAPHKLAALPS